MKVIKVVKVFFIKETLLSSSQLVNSEREIVESKKTGIFSPFE